MTNLIYIRAFTAMFPDFSEKIQLKFQKQVYTRDGKLFQLLFFKIDYEDNLEDLKRLL